MPSYRLRAISIMSPSLKAGTCFVISSFLHKVRRYENLKRVIETHMLRNLTSSTCTNGGLSFMHKNLFIIVQIYSNWHSGENNRKWSNLDIFSLFWTLTDFSTCRILHDLFSWPKYLYILNSEYFYVIHDLTNLICVNNFV